MVTVMGSRANSGRRFRAYLTGGAEQADAVARTDGCCRVVGRLAIERHEMRGSFGGRCPAAPSVQLTELRADVDWLVDTPVHALQQELRCVDAAFENWVKHGRGYPKPRKRKDGVRIRFADPKDWRIEKVRKGWWRIRLPKLGWFLFRKHRALGGEIRSVTLTSAAGRWHVSFGICARKPQAKAKPGVVGVDLGVTETVATSRPIDLRDGEGPQRLHRMQPLLTEGEKKHLLALERKAGRQAEARKRRGGPITKAHRKTFQAIARIHARIARRRGDWLRKMAHTLGEFGAVVFENIVVANVTRSAKGTVEEPGRNVAAKSGLNRAILNSGWGYLRTFCAEKTAVVKVSAAYTSQECRRCGHVCAENRPERDEFRCVLCGYANHADLNAADNIEARGTRVLSGEATAPDVAACSRKADGTKNGKAKAA